MTTNDLAMIVTKPYLVDVSNLGTYSKHVALQQLHIPVGITSNLS